MLREAIKKHKYRSQVEQINRLESSLTPLPDEEFPKRVLELRRRRRQGASLAALLNDTYALVREATRRAIGIRQYDLQVAGAVALSQGQVIEMNTGEGKTFVAPLAACLHALDHRGVHILTANDYLAGRDAAILEPVYTMLGFTVGVVLSDTPHRDRAKAYRADVTYTTVRQLGFDFLREYFEQDPDALRQRDLWRYMKSEIDGGDRRDRCLRGRYFAILDEVDSILVDYARSPVSIAIEADLQRSRETYDLAREFALNQMGEPKDFTLDKIRRVVKITDAGKKKIESLAQEYGYLHLLVVEWEERVQEALFVEHLMKRGEHYVVRDDTALLIDQTSGRLMIGQRMGGEMHQALEVKERISVRPRQTVAKSITVQSLIRPYEKLAGMTGTAWEARTEFSSVYNMNTVRFAPRLALHRAQGPDLIFATSRARWEAAAADIASRHSKGQPVLVGTRSVEKSRHLSKLLESAGVPHRTLNGVDHADEAQVIAWAGQKGSVTVATNLAGRGVEIKLGDGVEKLGGMCVIGTERHLLRRLDRQLGGRCGRRGQPGLVQFYASLEDDLLEAIPKGTVERLRRRYRRAGEGPISSRSLPRIFEHGQRQYARRFATVRKALLVKDLAQEETDRILFGQDRL